MTSDTIRDHAVREHSLALINTRALEFSAFFEQRKTAISRGELEDIIQAERCLQDRWKDLLDAVTARPREAEPAPSQPKPCPSIFKDAPGPFSCELEAGHASLHRAPYVSADGKWWAWTGSDSPAPKEAGPRGCTSILDGTWCVLMANHAGRHWDPEIGSWVNTDAPDRKPSLDWNDKPHNFEAPKCDAKSPTGATR